MDKSLVSLRRKFMILGLFATATVLFLAPRASAGSFASTFNLGSMNVSDFSVPPNVAIPIQIIGAKTQETEARHMGIASTAGKHWRAAAHPELG